MGYPGSGKSTTAKEIEGSKSEIKYEIISGDKLKTTKRKLKKLKKVLESGNSAIVDSTNPSKEMRKKYLHKSVDHYWKQHSQNPVRYTF